MASRAYYLREAKSCFDMATMTRDSVVRDRWIERANEHLIQADALGDDSLPELPLAEPVQQQQSKSKDES
jgi:hypothetical protein